MPRSRTFRRVRLDELDGLDDEWTPAERGDGRVMFTIFSAGHGEETLAELRTDFADALAASMERQDR